MNDQIRLLRVNIEGVQLFENNNFAMQLINHQNVHRDNDSENMINLFSSVYLPRLIGLVGINAAGKTSSLRLMAWILRVFLCNEGLADEDFEQVYEILSENVTVEIHYVLHDVIYFQRSLINLNRSNRTYAFSNEVIYARTLDAKLIRKNLFDINRYRELYTRSELDTNVRTFLEDQKSIARLVIGKVNVNVVDLTAHERWFPEASSARQDLISIVRFLDHSVEELSPIQGYERTNRLTDETLFQFKFTGGEMMLVRWSEVLGMLSSGTKKGIELFQLIKETLHKGGYLIIDEIENHFNKSIVVDIYKLFRSDKTNPLGAMLIFSTHYTELMDDFERNDQIYINAKSHDFKRIRVMNLSELIRRTDLKKSEVYFSNALDIGTSTRYDRYMDLQRYLTNKDESLGERHGIKE